MNKNRETENRPLSYGSSWYYLKSSGAMAKSETMTISGTVNQFDANGAWIG